MTNPIDTATVAVVFDFSRAMSTARRQIDSALRDVASSVETAMGHVEREVDSAARELGSDFQIGGERAEAALHEVSRAATVSMAEVSAKSSAAATTMGTRLTAAATAAKVAILGIGLGVAAGLGALTAFGLKSAASMEQTQIGLEALVGSAEEARKFMGELQQFAAKTPFEFAGVADASRRILAFGQSVGIARDEVIPTITTIGDLVSVLGGTQENVDGVIRAFGQIASKGRLMGGEILQIAEQLPGFNANAAIAAATGMSVADAMKAQEAGAIDATTAINGLLEGMRNFKGAAGAMEKQSQTLLGVFSTFKDTMSIALTNAFQPVIPLIKQTLSDLTPVLGGVLNTLAPVLGKALGAILPLLGQLAQAITPIVEPLVEALGPALAALGPSLVPLGEALGELVKGLAPMLPLLAELLVLGLQFLIPMILTWAKAFQSLAPIVNAITGAIHALNNVLSPLRETLTPLITTVQDLAGTFEGEGGLSGVVDRVKEGLSTIGDFFAALPGRILGFLQALPGMLATFATNAINGMAFAIGFGIGKIIRFFIDLPGNIVTLVTQLWATVTALFTTGVENAKNNAITGFQNLLSFIQSLPSRAIEFLKELPGRLAAFGVELKNKAIEIGKSIVNGIIDGIKNTISGVGSTLKNGLGSALSGLKKGLGIGSPSKVFADEVGKQIPAGIAAGVDAGMAAFDVGRMISPIMPSAAPAAAAAGTTISGIVVNVSFAGVVPTQAQAKATGAAAGEGVLSALQRRGIQLAVQTARGVVS